MQTLFDVLGALGAVLIVTAYALTSTGRLEARSGAAALINLGGSVGLIANTWYHGAMPPLVLNVFWAGIALFALVRLRLAGAEPLEEARP